MASYHFGYCDRHGTPASGTTGKMFRAALTLATASAFGAAPAAVRYAAAVELIHNFTLIHDDILDGDVERRGRPTVWAIWGKPPALLLGDALHALAIEILTDTRGPEGRCDEAVRRIEQAVVDMCRGQYEDCDFTERRPVTVDAYLEMAAGKTGALTGCACALGALAAGADVRVVDALESFGRRVGVAFQLIDDIIGIWGDPAETGKTASDIAERRMTMPIVAAIASGTDAGRELAALYKPASQRDSGRHGIPHIADLIASAGGRERTRRRAELWTNSAIVELPCGGTPFNELVELARAALRRDR
ncbi:polyprenyl synthetase family protein [Nocardia sp. CDC159]|uniref:Polyprenyl synthetase family protein n=1 Tax=Nocardia pulmonis TaxID=2951408 RepID=A0A9X2J1T6_9NOCA|nr:MULTISPECIES: polyprenyl synthetase family protein [Nocardia]MCM6778450.1 polyprenyl synthetase family protein [Nocardia pulmonis]MCM6791339.1 polyprenyl synthetase family protein [Nocardia sp. CDC159]